jgi:hypothetical protein
MRAGVRRSSASRSYWHCIVIMLQVVDDMLHAGQILGNPLGPA